MHGWPWWIAVLLHPAAWFVLLALAGGGVWALVRRTAKEPKK